MLGDSYDEQLLIDGAVNSKNRLVLLPKEVPGSSLEIVRLFTRLLYKAQMAAASTAAAASIMLVVA